MLAPPRAKPPPPHGNVLLDSKLLLLRLIPDLDQNGQSHRTADCPQHPPWAQMLHSNQPTLLQGSTRVKRILGRFQEPTITRRHRHWNLMFNASQLSRPSLERHLLLRPTLSSPTPPPTSTSLRWVHTTLRHST